MTGEKIRLQKVMADYGVASRRKSEELIKAGKVKVNGETVKELGTKIDPRVEKVSVNGKIINGGDEGEFGARKVYLMVNKPVGFVTTTQDELGRRTVMELLKAENYQSVKGEKELSREEMEMILKTRLFPVGRLDIETSGLLFLTNDGAWAQEMTHPSQEVWKTYIAVTAGGEWNEKILEKFRGGLRLGRGAERLTAPAEIRLLERYRDGSRKMEIKVREGQNHQVRRMCAAVNRPVIKLERVGEGEYELAGLKAGHWRLL